MRNGMHFNFDGKWSYNMGVTRVNMDGGLLEDTIISSKKIIEERVEGRDAPYFYGVEREPLSFSLTLLFENNLSTEKVREVLRWLDKNDYRPFYMENDPDRIWYVMAVDDVTAIHNGIKSGVLQLNLRTDSPTTLTPYTLSQVYSFRNNSGGRQIVFNNLGDFECKPIVHITKVGNGDIIIQNLTNPTGNFEFTNLTNGEQLYVDCENKEIETSGIRHRYNDFSNNYLTFIPGENRLLVIGDCDIQFETEFKIY